MPLRSPAAMPTLSAFPRLLPLLLALPLLAAPGCSRGHCHPKAAGGAGNPPANLPPTVAVLAPDEDVEVEIGDSFEIEIVAEDDDDVATTRVRVLPEGKGGDPSTLVAALPEQNGATQTVAWNTTGFAPGVYVIEARTTDGKATAEDVSAGRVTLLEPQGGGGGGKGGDGESLTGGSGSEERGLSVGTFADGSFVLSGTFKSATTLGKGEPNETSLVAGAPNQTESFLARFRRDSQLAWARGLQSSGGFGSSFSVAASALDGSSVLAAAVSSPVTGATVTVSAGKPDALDLQLPATPGFITGSTVLARYGPNGELLWAQTILRAAVASVAIVPEAIAGNAGILVTGTMGTTVVAPPVVFAPGTPQEVSIQLGIETNWFVARYEEDGTLSFVKRGFGAASQFHNGLGVAAFADGSFALMGELAGGSVTFGAGEPAQTSVNAPGQTFLARFAQDGSFLWVRTPQPAISVGTRADFCDVAALPDGTSVFRFFPDNFGNDTTVGFAGSAVSVTTTAASPTVLAAISATGEPLWARALGGLPEFFVAGPSLSAFSDGSVAATGMILSSPATFGPGEILETTLVPPSGTPEYVARFSGADGSLVYVRASSGASAFASSVGTFPDGRAVAVGTFGGIVSFDVGEATPFVPTTPATGTDFYAIRLAP